MLQDGPIGALAGTFTGVDRIQASEWSEAESVRAEAEATWALAGGLLVQRWRDDREAGTFELLNVFMEDPASGEVLLYAFDSLGYPPDPPARGVWTDGSLVLLRTTERGESRTEFTPFEDGFRWRKLFRPAIDAEWTPVVDGDLVREPDL
jgi:hypothetical protein